MDKLKLDATKVGCPPCAVGERPIRDSIAFGAHNTLWSPDAIGYLGSLSVEPDPRLTFVAQAFLQFTKQRTMPANLNLLQRFGRHWISAILFLIPLVLYLVGTLRLQLPELYHHVLLTITAVMGIHVLDRLFIIKDTEAALDSLGRGIRDDVSLQTAILAECIEITRSA